MDEIHTTVDIEAPPETVWSVLTDFDAYPEWNPRTIITGRPTPGARLHVAPGPEAGRMPTFRPRVLRADPESELVWRGHLWIRGLFDGEHRFTLEDRGEGTTRLVQSERFGGLLARPILRLVGAETERGFHTVNAALKARAESLSNADPVDVAGTVT